MSSPLSSAQKIRRLPWALGWSFLGNMATHLSFGASVFVLFLADLGLDKAQIGTVRGLIPFVGIVALTAAPLIERVGPKRAFIGFYGARYVVLTALIAAPAVLAATTVAGAFAFVVAVILVFGVCRAVGEAAFYPWQQEYVPNTVRGKFLALEHGVGTSGGVVALSVAGLVLARASGGGYRTLFALGAAFGLVSVAFMSLVPGGGSRTAPKQDRPAVRRMIATLADGQFRRFLGAHSLWYVGTSSIMAFLPLYLREVVGLGRSTVVLLDSVILVGGMVFSLAWGWAVDRFGSRPVAVGAGAAAVVLPLCWMLVPSVGGAWAATILCVAVGAVSVAGSLAGMHLLMNTIVPPEQKTSYLPVWYAGIGIIGGAGPVLSGIVVDASAGVSGQLWLFRASPYTPLFLGASVVLAASSLLYHTLRQETAFRTRDLLGMLVKGNIFIAAGALLRRNFAVDAAARMLLARRMGDSRSDLHRDELVESLDDPSFQVRLEALISISRARRSDVYVQALLKILEQGEEALRPLASWALGRLGDRGALSALRIALRSGRRGLEEQSARALGVLEDHESAGELLGRLADTTLRSSHICYASALGALRCEEALLPVLDLVGRSRGGEAMEAASAAARILGQEERFIRLWRRWRAGGTEAVASHLYGRRRAVKRRDGEEALPILDGAIEALTAGRSESAVPGFVAIVDLRARRESRPRMRAALEVLAEMLRSGRGERQACLLLTIVMLSA